MNPQANVDTRTLRIGIPYRDEPERLLATLQALRGQLSSSTELWVLAGGGGEAPSFLADFSACRVVAESDRPAGFPSCFNRLVEDLGADVFVLLENGCVPGPGWLERLLAALEADPRHGLAGPSTNLCWNEQRAFAGAGGSMADIERTARIAVERYGDSWAYLEPLHSLAEFCYAVKREVVEAIGAADEGYGPGPCWEMDYNIRAARAGFRGVWAKGAFVWRPQPTARTRQEQAERFDAAKRRYQDRFCGLRIRGQTQGYEPHCKGEACPHFAPRGEVGLRLGFDQKRETGKSAVLPAPSAHETPSRPKPLPACLNAIELRTLPLAGGGQGEGRKLGKVGDLQTSVVPSHSLPPSQPSPFKGEGVNSTVLPAPLSGASAPLVSCLMPTRNRRSYVPAAIAAFLRQDYENRELVIVDDGDEPVADLVPQDPRIRYVRETRRQSLGAKRNVACSLAHGEILAHWDDDDWHAPWRLSYQVGELTSRQADMCGLDRLWFYDPSSDRAWHYRYAGGRSRWLAGGTFCFRKALWERHRFADITNGEDTRFVREAGFARIVVLDRDDFYVARVHAGNTCAKHTGGTNWRAFASQTIRDMLGPDFAGFCNEAPIAGDSPASASAAAGEETPLVSCIMPTFDRRPFVSLSLERFFEQDYPNKELIVVDDGDDAIGDLLSGREEVRYLRLSGRRSIGYKRNLACGQAAGEIIMQWDDDDWYAPDRISRQAGPIRAGRADVTGIRGTIVMSMPSGDFWNLSPELHRRLFFGDVHGGTLAFAKPVWTGGARYPDRSLAEDAAFLRQSLQQGWRLECVENEDLFAYTRHRRNAWKIGVGQEVDPRGWMKAHPPASLTPETIAAYKAVALRFESRGAVPDSISPRSNCQG